MIRRFSSAFVFALAVSGLGCCTHLASAEPSSPEIATARRLFGEAAELRGAGKWAEAAGKLREAIAIKETAGLRFHLAHCEEQDGQLVAAARDYDRADELIRAGEKKADDVAALLAPARAALSERIPSLVVKIPPDLENVAVSVDGVSLERAVIGTRMLLDPGVHTVEAGALHRAPFVLEVRLAEGEDRVVDATLPLPVASKPPAPRPAFVAPVARAIPVESTSSFGLREVVLIGESALAVGGAAVGVVFLLKRGEATARIDAIATRINTTAPDMGDISSCNPPTRLLEAECHSLQRAIDERRQDGTIAAIGFIGGGAGLAAAGLTWLLWPAGHATASLAVTPVVGGALVHGAF